MAYVNPNEKTQQMSLHNRAGLGLVTNNNYLFSPSKNAPTSLASIIAPQPNQESLENYRKQFFRDVSIKPYLPENKNNKNLSKQEQQSVLNPSSFGGSLYRQNNTNEPPVAINPQQLATQRQANYQAHQATIDPAAYERNPNIRKLLNIEPISDEEYEKRAAAMANSAPSRMTSNPVPQNPATKITDMPERIRSAGPSPSVPASTQTQSSATSPVLPASSYPDSSSDAWRAIRETTPEQLKAGAQAIKDTQSERDFYKGRNAAQAAIAADGGSLVDVQPKGTKEGQSVRYVGTDSSGNAQYEIYGKDGLQGSMALPPGFMGKTGRQGGGTLSVIGGRTKEEQDAINERVKQINGQTDAMRSLRNANRQAQGLPTVEQEEQMNAMQAMMSRFTPDLSRFDDQQAALMKQLQDAQGIRGPGKGRQRRDAVEAAQSGLAQIAAARNAAQQQGQTNLNFAQQAMQTQAGQEAARAKAAQDYNQWLAELGIKRDQLTNEQQKQMYDIYNAGVGRNIDIARLNLDASKSSKERYGIHPEVLKYVYTEGMTKDGGKTYVYNPEVASQLFPAYPENPNQRFPDKVYSTPGGLVMVDENGNPVSVIGNVTRK